MMVLINDSVDDGVHERVLTMVLINESVDDGVH